jgi:2OG-Fe(II) oxygenase superfamily
MGADPVLDAPALQQSILDLAPSMAQGLVKDGYWTTTNPQQELLPLDMIRLIRQQALELRRQGRYEPSWSERIVVGGTPSGGSGRSGSLPQTTTERFEKNGVWACEPDGQDYDTAPDMIVYLSVLLQTLPMALNQAILDNHVTTPTTTIRHPDLSNTSFNAKLAVTLPGGSTYPLHVDNPQGLQANDTRKLTCILYLNPDYDATRGDGGELRLTIGGNPTMADDDDDDDDDNKEEETTTQIDVTPEGGRMVLFWSDEIPHEVLPTAPDYVVVSSSVDDEPNLVTIVDNPLDRYALTIWIPTRDVSTLHNESSRFRSLRDLAFSSASTNF